MLTAADIEADGDRGLRAHQRTLELLIQENEALRAVLARLQQENLRLAESLLRANSKVQRTEGV
jgi:hypothetical protein